MGKTKPIKQVEFPTYCEAFKALERASGYSGPKICGLLDNGVGAYEIDVMMRGEAGDGYVSVPDYNIVLGRLEKTGTVEISQDGRVSNMNVSLDPLKAKYFIAGAFGASEVVGGASLDQTIVDGLRELYSLCSDDWETCLDSPAAKAVAQAWSTIVDGRRELSSKRSDVKLLKYKYERAAKEVQDKSELAVKVAHLAGAVSEEPATVGECLVAERNLIAMKAIAEGMVAEEGRVAVEAKATEERQGEIDGLNEDADEIWGEVQSYYDKARASANPFVHDSAIKKAMDPYRGYQFYSGAAEFMQKAQIRRDMAVQMMKDVADTWTGYKYFKEDHCRRSVTRVDDCTDRVHFYCDYGVKSHRYTTDTCKKDTPSHQNEYYGGMYGGR